MSLKILKSGCNPGCRGCSHREFTLEQSLHQKQGFVSKVLNQWNDRINPVISPQEDQRWSYRTSVTLAAEWNGQQWLFGTKSMDEVIPIHNCPVHQPIANKTIAVLSSVLPEYNLFRLAYLVLSKAQCTLIVKQKELTSTPWLTDELKEKLQNIGIEGFWIHCNPSAGRRLFEKGGWLLLFGQHRSRDLVGLVYGPASFQQQIQWLYLETLAKAEGFLRPDPNSAVVDLYCGTGTSSARWIKNGASVIGVETGGEALECAGVNAPEAHFLRGSARLRVPQINSWVDKRRTNGFDILLYANPPRTGMEPEVLQWIVTQGKPQRIAYLSCSPGTLSKNLNFLSQNGYRVVEITPYDFFPNTHHIECLALIECENIV